MDSPLRVFVSCADIVQGSYFEVLFHQLPDGAVPKLAADRKMMIDGRTMRVSLTTDSGLAQYPARLLDMFRQADVIVFLYSMVDRAVFEGLPERFEWVSGPARDFEPATFITLGIIPPNAGDTPHVISPQEVESMCSQYSATNYLLDIRTQHKDLDELWSFAVRTHQARLKSTSSGAGYSGASGHGGGTSSASYNASSSSSSASTAALSPRSQLLSKEETLVQLTSTLITRKESPSDLTKAIASQSAKKTEKIFKQAIKATGKRELLSISPSRIDITHATLLEPSFVTFSITTTSKTPVSWSINEAETVENAYFFAIHESSGTVTKSKPATVTICCTFYQPAELSRFILIDSPQEPGLSAPLFVKFVAPLQPRDPLQYWTIDRKAISIGFRISSTLSANVYRSTLYGAVVAVKEWSTDAVTGRPPDLFYTEWDAFVKLKHPNIAQFLGGSKERGEAFMILEYLKHGQLGTFLHNPPPRGVVRTIDLRLKMATDLAKAMAYLHSQKMLHRDLTSANVLVDSDCSVKLGDFGEPRQIGAAAQMSLNATFNGRNDFGGNNFASGDSLDWTAPELLAANGASAHTQKSDVFSYGVILWEFGAERMPARTLADVRNGVLPFLPMDVKTRYPAFNDLVLHCTSVAPELRPTFDEIVARLETIRANGPTPLAPAPLGKTPATMQGNSGNGAPPSSKYLPPPMFNASNNTTAAPSRILYRGQVHGSPKQQQPGSSNNGNVIASQTSGLAMAAPPASQRLVDAVILPEMSVGPGQLSPIPIVSPTAASPLTYNAFANPPKQASPPASAIAHSSAAQAHSAAAISLTHTSEGGVMPASGPVNPLQPSTVSPPGSQGSSPLLPHAMATRPSPPPSFVGGPNAHPSHIASPRGDAADAGNAGGNRLGLLPAAMPLTAPSRSGAVPTQFVAPAPSQYAPPSGGDQHQNPALSSANSLPLLRLPSLSQFNGAPQLAPPQGVVSPRGVGSQQSSVSPPGANNPLSPTSQANAKDDNLLNWASDAYDPHEQEKAAKMVTEPQRSNTGAPPVSSISSARSAPLSHTINSSATSSATVGPRVPFVPAPLFSPRLAQGGIVSPRTGVPAASQSAPAPSSATSPTTKPNPLSN